jgi:hypothetical protein
MSGTCSGTTIDFIGSSGQISTSSATTTSLSNGELGGQIVTITAGATAGMPKLQEIPSGLSAVRRLRWHLPRYNRIEVEKDPG